MTKSELIEKIAISQDQLPPRDVEQAVRMILERMANALVSKQRIEIRGFGVFSKKYIRPRRFINPKTKKESFISETATVHFKASRRLLDSYD